MGRRLPDKCILKKIYIAQGREAITEKISAPQRPCGNKKYYKQIFLIGPYSGKNAVKSF
jgi:hypothetical protein